MILSSGRGLHCYWLFDRDVDAQAARGAMSAFSAALTDHGLLHDPSRTGDVASILRPAGTHNHKQSGKRFPVGLIRLAEPIDPAVLHSRFKAGLAGSPLKIPGAQVDGWETGVEEYPTASAKRIVAQCPTLYAVAKVKGAVEEPLWRTMLGLIKHTEEGETLAHTWSKGDKRYSYEETQEKIDNWDKPPPTCDAFAEHSDACKACPHRGKITSPYALGMPPKEIPTRERAEPEKPQKTYTLKELRAFAACDTPEDLPFFDKKKYSWDGETLAVWAPDPSWLRKGKVVMDWVPFSKKLYYPYLRYEKEHSGWGVQICALVDPARGIWREFGFDQKKIARNADMAQELANHEVHMTDTQAKIHRQYVQDVLQGLTDLGIETKTHNAFGWVKGGFVTGPEMITAKGREPVLLAENIKYPLDEGIGQAGTVEGWCTIVDTVYNRPGAEPLQFCIVAAAASILVKLANSDMWRGLPLGLVGDSGEGKSTIGKVGCSIFGDPQIMTISATDHSTTLSALMGRVGIFNNLPLVMDEITGRSPEDLQHVMYAMSNGQRKQRLNQDGTMQDGNKKWNMISFITSNESILEALGATDTQRAEATQVRCFEIPFERGYLRRVFRDVDAKNLIEFELLGKNYGMVGEELITYVARNTESITRALQRRMAHYAKRTNAQNQERFYYDLIATVEVMGMIMQKLGYIKWDIRAMTRWACNHVLALRSMRTSSVSTPEDFLSAFLAYLEPHTFVTDHYRDGRSGKVEYNQNQHAREIYARHAMKDRRLMFMQKAFNEWCERQKVSPKWLKTQLMAEGLVLGEPQRMRLGRGTAMMTPQSHCYEVNYDRLDEAGVAIPAHISVIEGGKQEDQNEQRN
jgi:hypothetical protein